jgi:Zn-dependent protease
MFNTAFKVARVWGIPIKLHVSLIALLVYIAVVVLASGGGVLGLILALCVLEPLILLSIALHELGHSFVAMRKGCRVREITLLFIGGVAQMEQIPQRPRDEFQMAIAGPAVSLVIGLTLFYGGGYVQAATRNMWLQTLGTTLHWVGQANFILTGFNLIPAFPMDGGRVLRALLSAKLGRLRATFVAARMGRIVAVIFGLVGWFGLKDVRYFPPGYWPLIIIAFFIFAAAGNEYRAERLKQARRRQAHGGGRDPFGATWGPPPDPDDQVVISPPPYSREPDQRTEVRHLDGNG